MRSLTVSLKDDSVVDAAQARADKAGLPLDDYLRREIKRVLHGALELGQLPPITRKYLGIAPSITDNEFREFRRGYLTRKHE